MKTCSHCLERNAAHTCSKCKREFYCGKECQDKHWKLGHAQLCDATANVPRRKSLDVDQLLDMAQKDLKDIPALPQTFFKPGSKDLILKEQIKLMYGVYHQKVVVDELWQNVLRAKGVESAQIESLNYMWKQAENVLSTGDFDKKSKLDEWMDKISLLSNVVTKSELLPTTTAEDDERCNWLFFEPLFKDVIDLYIGAFPENDKPLNSELLRYFEESAARGSFLESKPENEFVCGKPSFMQDYDTDDDDPSYKYTEEYEEDDEPEPDETEGRRPYQFGFNGQHFLADDTAEAQAELRNYTSGRGDYDRNMDFRLEFENLERLLNGGELDHSQDVPWYHWKKSYRLFQHYFQRGNNVFVRLFTGFVNSQAQEKGVGALIAILGFFMTLGTVYAPSYMFRNYVNNQIKKMHDAHTTLLSQPEKDRKTQEFLQNTLNNMEANVNRLHNATDTSLTRKTVELAYWDLLGSINSSNLEERKDIADSILQSVIESLSKQTQKAATVDIESTVRATLTKALGVIRTSPNSAEITEQVNSVTGFFNALFLTKDEMQLPDNVKAELAIQMKGLRETVNTALADIAVNKEEILSYIKTVQDSSNVITSAAKEASDVAKNPVVRLALKQIDPASFIRDYVAETTGVGFVGQEIFDFFLSDFISVSKSMDRYMQSAHGKELVSELGITWAAIGSTMGMNIFVVTGMWMAFSHWKLKWLFGLLANFTGDPAQYHRDRHEVLLRSLIHHSYPSEEGDTLEDLKPLPRNGNIDWFARTITEIRHSRTMEIGLELQHMTWSFLWKHGATFGIAVALAGIIFSYKTLMWDALKYSLLASGGGLVWRGVDLAISSRGVIIELVKRTRIYDTGLSALMGLKEVSKKQLSRGMGLRYKKQSTTEDRIEEPSPVFVRAGQRLLYNGIRYYDWILIIVTLLWQFKWVTKYMWMGKNLTWK